MTHYVSYRRHMTAAGFEGFGLVLQRAGTVTKYLKVYESGAGTNGTVGMKRVVYEVQRYLKVHCFPASRAGALRSTPAGAGAVVRGVSHYATKFTPIGAGTYYPPLPAHRRQVNFPEAAPDQKAPRPTPESPHHGLRNPLAPASGTAMSYAAAMRRTEHENQGLARDEEERVSASAKGRRYSRTPGHEYGRRHAL